MATGNLGLYCTCIHTIFKRFSRTYSKDWY